MDIALGFASFLSVFYVIWHTNRNKINHSISSFTQVKKINDSVFSHYHQLGYRSDLIEATYTNLYQLFGTCKKEDFCYDKKLQTLLKKDDTKDLLIDICIDLKLDFPKNTEIKTFEKNHGEINSFEKILQFVTENRLNK